MSTKLQLEYKSAPLEIKAAGDQGIYDGWFSIFQNIDDGGDIVYPGAFAKTIQERGKRVKVLYAHDWDKLIGPPPQVLQEDTKGLYAKGKLTLESFWGREAWALMKDGALTEGSFGYSAIPERTDYNSNGTRGLREIILYEISPVPLGMNPLTEVAAIKAMKLGDDSGEAYLTALHAVVQQLKEGRVLSSTNLSLVKNVHGSLAELMGLLEDLINAAAPEPEKGIHPAPLEEQLRLQELKLTLAQKGVYVG
jgi:uncharacterized protein